MQSMHSDPDWSRHIPESPSYNIPASAALPLSPSITRLPPLPWDDTESQLPAAVVTEDSVSYDDSETGGQDSIKNCSTHISASEALSLHMGEQEAAWANKTCHVEGCSSRPVTHGRCGPERRKQRVWQNFACAPCAVENPLYLPLQGQNAMIAYILACCSALYDRFIPAPES